MSQIKNTFDQATLIKIGKGAIISAIGAGVLYLLSAVGALDIGNPTLTSFIAWLVPMATNAIKEYMKGEGLKVDLGSGDQNPISTLTRPEGVDNDPPQS